MTMVLVMSTIAHNVRIYVAPNTTDDNDNDSYSHSESSEGKTTTT